MPMTLTEALAHPALHTLKPSCTRTPEEREALSIVKRYHRVLQLLTMHGYGDEVQRLQRRDPVLLQELDEVLHDPAYIAWLESPVSSAGMGAGNRADRIVVFLLVDVVDESAA